MVNVLPNSNMNSQDDEVIQIDDSDSHDSSLEDKDAAVISKKVYDVESSDSDSSDEVEWLEEDSESEPEIDCPAWDADCRVVSICNKDNELVGFHSMAIIPEPPEPPHKQKKVSYAINESLTSDVFVKELQGKWESEKHFESANVDLIVEPFKICVLRNFVSSEPLLEEARLQFDELYWNRRSLDLYEFHQSLDLKYIVDGNLKIMYDFLKNDVMDWVSKLTGVKLTMVSATCSCYSDTDFLLVHDDLKDDRMFAYVLYLTGKEGWDVNWGGALQLRASDESGQPTEVAKEIYPVNNQLVIFPVTNKSYHQVAEVVTKNYSRLSINGWFHTDDVPTFEAPHYEQPTAGLFSKNSSAALNIAASLETWVARNYLNNNTMEEIQKHIENDSEISLRKFFITSRLKEVEESLKSTSRNWQHVGPTNRRSYEVLVEEDLPEVLQQFIDMFKSCEMFSLLHRYTDLALVSENAKMRYEVQRWQSGSYSLLTDYDWENKEELDVILYLGCPPSKVVGGRTEYASLDGEMEHALITLEPVENNLNLVYRDTARFTSYVSKHTSLSHFYLIVCSYTEG